MPDRKTSSVLRAVIAECDGCQWASRARNAVGNAARHHDATGHHVRVEVTRVISFGDLPRPEDHGQTAIPDVLTPS